MRDFSKVTAGIWIGATGRELRRRGQVAQLVALYLISSPHATMTGLYPLPKAYLANDTGLTFEGASKGLQDCIESGFCEYDESAEMVWVRRMARFQVAEALKPGDKQVLGIANELRRLPRTYLISRFVAAYGASFHLNPGDFTPSPIDEASQGPANGASEGPSQAPPKPRERDRAEDRAGAKAEDRAGVAGPGGPAGDQTLPGIPEADASAAPNCPHRAIIDLYHQCMPTLPRVKVSRWSGSASEESLRVRWKEGISAREGWFRYGTTDEGIAVWRRFFETCEQSDFLTGRVAPSAGRDRAFIADLHWLLKRANFDKVLSNNYVNKGRPGDRPHLALALAVAA